MAILNMAYSSGGGGGGGVTTPGIYHNPVLGLISLSSDGNTWVTVADKNLGATSTDVSNTNSYGNYYQWGNNHGFPYKVTLTTSSSIVPSGGYGPGNYYDSSTWITASPWDGGGNANLWGGTTGTNAAMQGPCQDGYHIPKDTEFTNLIAILAALGLNTSNGTVLQTYLFAPYPGYQNFNGTYAGVGSDAYFWASTGNNSGQAYNIRYRPSSMSVQTYSNAYGWQIRPFKNTAVQPDNTRTVLYS